MIGPIVADEAATEAANPGGIRPCLIIIWVTSLPGPAASAIADPDMPEKMMLTRISTCARPPRNRPTMAWQKSNNRSDTPLAFMILAARIKSGTASRTNES